jgi:ubiquinone/menaquinone biosynthesis C-methylase UbiE
LVFVNPRPSQSEIQKYYPANYPSYLPSKGIQRFLKKNLLKKEIQYWRRRLPPHAAFLEVGAGGGEDLAFLKNHSDWQVTGTDISNDAAAEAKKRFNLSVSIGLLEELKLPGEHYDAIRMKYIISHVHSPKRLLTEAHRLLKPGGYLMMWLPNIDSFDQEIFGPHWEGQEPPRHLYDFSEATIRAYLQKSGFTVERVIHSIVPNTYIHAFRRLLEDRGLKKLAKLVTINPVTLALAFPIAFVAALFHKSGRIIIQAKK